MSLFEKPGAIIGSFVFGFLWWIICIAGVSQIGTATNSGWLGINRSYGDHARLIGFLYLASIPLCVIVGVLGYLCLRRGRGKAAEKEDANGK